MATTVKTETQYRIMVKGGRWREYSSWVRNREVAKRHLAHARERYPDYEFKAQERTITVTTEVTNWKDTSLWKE